MAWTFFLRWQSLHVSKSREQKSIECSTFFITLGLSYPLFIICQVFIIALMMHYFHIINGIWFSVGPLMSPVYIVCSMPGIKSPFMPVIFLLYQILLAEYFVKYSNVLCVGEIRMQNTIGWFIVFYLQIKLLIKTTFYLVCCRLNRFSKIWSKRNGKECCRLNAHIMLHCCLLVPYDCRPFQQHCLLNSHPNSGCACVWMAPFSFLIDDYWVLSDGSSLLANTREETTAKTAYLSDCSLNFRLMSCWQTQTLHGGVLQCPLPSFLYSIPETLWNLQSQH